MTKRVNNAHCRLRRPAIFLRYRDELTGPRDGQTAQDLFEASRAGKSSGNEGKSQAAKAAGNTSTAVTVRECLRRIPIIV